MTIRNAFPFVLVLLAALAAGCGSEEKEPVKGDYPAATGGDDDAFAALGAEDAALARKQEVCPVSGKPLGSMGTPVKVMVGDQAVFLCCESCRKSIEKDPERYLAKLKK